MPRQRNEKGQVIESYPAENVLAILDEIEAAGTQEVADELGSSYETAYKKLRALEDDGRITSRKIANARLWMPAKGHEAKA